jgi:aerotaxis receptor
MVTPEHGDHRGGRVHERQRPDVDEPAHELDLTYHDGTSRIVRYIDRETPFPVGELIVSQTDPQGLITMCNPAFELMSGYTEAELLGRPHHLVRHPDMPRAAFADLWATVSEGRRWSGYVKNLRKDGGYYWVFATVIPRLRDGTLLGYTSVRRAPSRAKVMAAAELYRGLLDAERAVAR